MSRSEMVGAEPRPESAARHTWIGASCRSPQRGMCHADSYDAALTALGSLISGKQRSHGERWKHAYDGMRVYLERLELDTRLHKLRVVHVAGTKGKGSTCAMVESILRNAGYTTGLFTSPHLVDVRERIRLNGRPIAKELFLEQFWWCHRRLADKSDAEYGMAAYFRFLTLVALRTFLEEGVDIAVMEVGLGGRLDATNCVRQPIVCGVAALGFDHMDVLGHTLPEIAREKAGIFKLGTPAFTVPQPPDALLALQEVADKVGAPLTVAQPLVQQYRVEGGGSELRMRLGGAHQLQNASLAVALASAWEAGSGISAAGAANRLKQLRQGVLPQAYVDGIESCEWPGRSQVVQEEVQGSSVQLSYFLDGAHTPESMATCAEWFAGVSAEAAARQPGADVQRVLVFNCKQERDPESLLSPLIQTLQRRQVLPQHALFVVPDSSYVSLAKNTDQVMRDTSWQQRLAEIWRARLPGAAAAPQAKGGTPQSRLAFPQLHSQNTTRGAAVPSLADTLKWLRRCAREQPSRHIQVLVTGSLYIVGDALRHLNRAP